MRNVLLALIFGGIAPHAVAVSQQRDDVFEIMYVAALETAQGLRVMDIPHPALAVVPDQLKGVHPGGNPLGLHDDRLVKAVAEQLGAQVRRFGEVYSCGVERPARCRLTGADALLALGIPEIRRDTARIAVGAWWKVLWRGQGEPPIGFSESAEMVNVYILERCQGKGWRIIGREGGSVS